MTHAKVPLNVGLTDMLDRIGGQKSARLPELLETVQPVAIYSDLSRSMASELFEPRAASSFDVFANAGRWGGLEMQAVTPGGLLVERITARSNFDAEGVAVAVNNFSSITLGATALGYLDIGGVPVEARPVSDADILALPPNHVAIYTDQNQVEDLSAERIYVPPGFYFLLVGHNANSRVQATIIWRELLDIQGA